MRALVALCLVLIAAPALAKEPTTDPTAPPADALKPATPPAPSQPAAPANPRQSPEFLRMMGRAEGADLQRRIEEASRHPLGSRENPVRVNSPAGERAYLGRLRCSNGVRPAFTRVGSFGAGVFGTIIDGYRVVCVGGSPGNSMIYMDMYFPDHDETAAPPGFTIVD